MGFRVSGGVVKQLSKPHGMSVSGDWILELKNLTTGEVGVFNGLGAAIGCGTHSVDLGAGDDWIVFHTDGDHDLYDFAGRASLSSIGSDRGPAFDELLGAPRATATMSRDHVEGERLAAELAGTPSTNRGTIARLACGLYALVSLHFAKEEEIYLELMDATMSAPAVLALYEQMEVAAADLKHGE